MKDKNYFTESIVSTLSPRERAVLIIKNYKSNRKLLTPQEVFVISCFNNLTDRAEFYRYLDAYMLLAPFIKKDIRLRFGDVVFCFESLNETYFRLRLDSFIKTLNRQMPECDEHYQNYLDSFLTIIHLTSPVFSQKKSEMVLKIKDHCLSEILTSIKRAREYINAFYELLKAKKELTGCLTEVELFEPDFEQEIIKYKDLILEMIRFHNDSFNLLVSISEIDKKLGIKKKRLEKIDDFLIGKPVIDKASVTKYTESVRGLAQMFH